MDRQDSQKKVRYRIYDAAEPLFARFGYRKTTIEDICKEAGISKRTFYEHFRDKPGLVHNVFMEIATDLFEEWIGGLDDSLNARGKIESFIDFYADIMAQRPIFQFMFEDQDAMKVTMTFFQEFGNAANEFPVIVTLKELLRQGQSEGCFRHFDENLLVWMITMLLDGMFLMMPKTYMDIETIDRDRFKTEIKRFVLHGLGAKND